MLLFVEQLLNGAQYGLLLFLVASGLTLIFGIMGVINLAHGSLFMIGAVLSVTFQQVLGSFWLALVLTMPATFVIGLAFERVLLRRLYVRNHLEQVLVTFGVILIANAGVKWIWGAAPLYSAVPQLLSGRVELIPAVPYPAYRIAVIVAGLATAAFLYGLITKTRLGIFIRAGASDREMTSMLGVNIGLIYMVVFALGAVLAGFAGLMAGPILSVQAGMGEQILILSFVVVVIGGMGSVRGAFAAAMIVGMLETLGRAYIRDALGVFLSPSGAAAAGPAIASMLNYILMTLVLVFRPEGLFAIKTRG